MKIRSGALLACLLILFLTLGLTYLLWLENLHKLEVLCAEKNWFACASALSGDFSLSLSGDDFKPHASQYLRDYFAELAGTQKLADLHAGKPLALFILKRAKFYEYQMNLPHLAEAYMRCAVGSYRYQCQQALANLKQSSTDQLKLKHTAADDLERLSLALRDLSKLYVNHNKFLIAERAAKESTDLASQALVLAGEDSEISERLHSQILLARAAHIKILRKQNQNKEADEESLLLGK